MKRNGIILLIGLALMSAKCNKKGCTDPKALNYNENIKEKNSEPSSCFYATPGIEGAATLECNAFSNAGTTYELIDLGLAVDYIVTCKMQVRCDLKIKPGVTIAFKTDAGLNVYPEGSINSIGTTESPISYTGFDAAVGSWAGIFIDSDDTKNKFDHSNIEFAGGDDFNSNGDKGALILYAYANVDVSNTTISQCASYGINANYSNGEFSFTNNTITTSTMPMFIAAEYASSISGGVFTGNTIDVIYMDTYGGDGVVKTNQSWPNLGVPYRVKGGGDISSDANLTIMPGVIIEFEAGSSFKTAENKSIKAVGTPSEKIIFRGVNPGPGAWKNIYFWGTNSLNEIGHAIISGGGEDPTNTNGSVFLWYNAKLNIHDVEFIDNAACGVAGRLTGGQSVNPNYSSANLTFTNTPCTESFVF